MQVSSFLRLSYLEKENKQVGMTEIVSGEASWVLRKVWWAWDRAGSLEERSTRAAAIRQGALRSISGLFAEVSREKQDL